MMNPYIQVALGGAAGATARFAIAQAMPGFTFAVATLFVNVLGCALMGLAAVAVAERGPLAWAPLLMPGFLGGFTTFSAFALDAASLWRHSFTAASLYVLLSVGLSLSAVALGIALGRMIWA